VCVYGLVFNIGKRSARSAWSASIESKELSERKRSGQSTKIPDNSLDLGVERNVDWLWTDRSGRGVCGCTTGTEGGAKFDSVRRRASAFTDGSEVQFWGPFKIPENDFWDGPNSAGRDNLESPVNCAPLQLVQIAQRGWMLASGSDTIANLTAMNAPRHGRASLLIDALLISPPT